MRLFNRSRPPSVVAPGAGADPSRAASALEQARSAEAQGRLLDALRWYEQAVGPDLDPQIEAHLVALRQQAFDHLAPSSTWPDWPRQLPDRFPPGVGHPPEVVGGQVSADELGSALVNHGSLIVRGALDSDRVPEFVAGIDRAFAGRDAWGAGTPVEQTAPWFVPFEPTGLQQDQSLSRRWVREGGGVWTADSPRMLARLIAELRADGLIEAITGYLGERPAMSVRKGALRRVPPDLGRADWHQDGAFLGPEVRSVNVWLALSDCGGDTACPGLDLVPRRMAEVLPTGTPGAWFDWSVADDLVAEATLDGAVACPRFAAGDALLFDDRLLHRTTTGEHLTENRYAIETWFFAPTGYPTYQIPLVI